MAVQPWYNLYNGLAYVAIVKPPLPLQRFHVLDVRQLETPVPALQRAGTIIATRERLRRSAALATMDPLSVIVALTRDQQACGEWYLDDGESFMYVHGHFFHKEMRVQKLRGGLLLSVKDKRPLDGAAVMAPWQRPFFGDLDIRTDEALRLTTDQRYAVNGSAAMISIERIVLRGLFDGPAETAQQPNAAMLKMKLSAEVFDNGVAKRNEMIIPVAHAQLTEHRDAKAPFGVETAGDQQIVTATWELVIKNPGIRAGQNWQIQIEW
jgi:hypothetical protein